MKKITFLLILTIILFGSSCATTVKIPEDMSAAEIIQRAQEASDRNRYNVALQYYKALYERNRTNLDLVITAEYEIAFIHYKQKRYDLARAELTALLEYYNTPDQALLPQHFKRLATIVLEQIDKKEEEQRNRFFWQRKRNNDEK